VPFYTKIGRFAFLSLLWDGLGAT